jgi:hypothetical protein
MTLTFAALKAHLERTGRIKLFPRILRELRASVARAEAGQSWKETAKQNPSLISGFRSIENGVLTDRTGKRALLDIYQKIIS